MSDDFIYYEFTNSDFLEMINNRVDEKYRNEVLSYFKDFIKYNENTTYTAEKLYIYFRSMYLEPEYDNISAELSPLLNHLRNLRDTERKNYNKSNQKYKYLEQDANELISGLNATYDELSDRLSSLEGLKEQATFTDNTSSESSVRINNFIYFYFTFVKQIVESCLIAINKINDILSIFIDMKDAQYSFEDKESYVNIEKKIYSLSRHVTIAFSYAHNIFNILDKVDRNIHDNIYPEIIDFFIKDYGVFLSLCKKIPGLTKNDIFKFHRINQIFHYHYKTSFDQNLISSPSLDAVALYKAVDSIKYNNKSNYSIETTILAQERTLKYKDSYTTAHQRRVAILSNKIASKMKLTEEHIFFIQLSARVHDIGKIHFTKELLEKRGTLTEEEYSHLCQHAQIGFDIIRTFDFDLPIQEIIYQHHERLDGSGYPRHLKDDEIMLEAKIIAVADTFEAMVTKRPYREELPMDLAIKAISNKNHYDPEIADICIRLFTEEGFSF